MKNNFYKNTIVLTASNVTVGILGFIFSIYLSKILGAEGMALYSLVMPVYNLFIALMTAGIIAAISKVSAIYSSENDYGNLFKTIKTVSTFNIIWAIIIGILVFSFADFLGTNWIKDPRTINAIKVTCPAMIFIALSNILKGYFYGTSKLFVPSFIDILEKALRIFIISLLIYFLKAKSLSSLVTVAYVALCIGELQSLILLFLYYRNLKKDIIVSSKKRESRLQLLMDVLVVSFPLCITGFLNNIFYTISALIVPRRLVSSGFKYGAALSMIGKYNGMALNIVTFPGVIINSLNTLLIPDLSQTMSEKNYYAVSKRIRDVLRLVFLIGIGTTVLCLSIPDSLGQMFFSRNDLGLYIKAAAITAPIQFLSLTMYGILNGLGRQGILLRNTIITETLEITLLFILTGISRINIFGYCITALIVHSLSLILNLYETNKVIEINFSIINIIIFILVGVLFYFSLSIISSLLINTNVIFKNVLFILITFIFFVLFALKYKISED
ncbi:stage V sporulation protein B [Clostridium fallax]|uniref:Multidrug-efflux transporter n=1 Tax=Clostridium fallax TaxID=1533 RepID=A0A1M4U4B0_9CLOT|nr:stage V sporulation protein B [Clostridium fallax]SHE51569.1 stage V sporulation protein B [Clostridium fallax]SQB06073.1 stage V sporulation protein B [Clostridium fallax]